MHLLTSMTKDMKVFFTNVIFVFRLNLEHLANAMRHKRFTTSFMMIFYRAFYYTTGTLGTTDLGAQTVVFNVETICYMVTFSPYFLFENTLYNLYWSINLHFIEIKV